jgi:hypothetical protein
MIPCKVVACATVAGTICDYETWVNNCRLISLSFCNATKDASCLRAHNKAKA